MSRKKKDILAKKIYAYLIENGPAYVNYIAEDLRADRRAVSAVLGMKKNMFYKLEITSDKLSDGMACKSAKWAARKEWSP